MTVYIIFAGEPSAQGGYVEGVYATEQAAVSTKAQLMKDNQYGVYWVEAWEVKS